jgi:hypothetical protein
MRRGSYDEEAARQPLLDSAFAGAAGAAASGSGRAGSGGGTSSRGLSPDRAAGEDGHPVHLRSAATPGGSIRLIKRPSNTAQVGCGGCSVRAPAFTPSVPELVNAAQHAAPPEVPIPL